MRIAYGAASTEIGFLLHHTALAISKTKATALCAQSQTTKKLKSAAKQSF
jgi:hypothetical protein